MSETVGVGPLVIEWRIDQWYPDIPQETRDKLKSFHSMLLQANKTHGLISPKTATFADALYFADSILASRMIAAAVPEMKEIFDLGSGSGFPGIVFALLHPHIRTVLVEMDARKCEFLASVKVQVKIPNIEILNSTVENLLPDSMQYCMARGLSTISKSILSTRRLVPRGGIFFHLKSEAWTTEVGQIATQLCSVWTPALLGEYRLPVGTMRFAIVRTDKIA